jgi:DNA-binding transcriptional ArsR family regulator
MNNQSSFHPTENIDDSLASDPPRGPIEAADFASLCKALGHPARIRIITHLKAMHRCICGEIVQVLPLAQSTVSQHLKTLKSAGLVIGEVEGPRTCYCLNRPVLEAFKQMAAKL